MFKILLSFLLLNLGHVYANEILSGSYGRLPNTLKINQTQGGIQLEGFFLGREYDYSIVNEETVYAIRGTLDGSKINMNLQPNTEVTELIDESSKTNVKFSLNTYVSFIDGRYLNYSASLRIEKSEEEHHITGFLLNHLYDLYIVKREGGFIFKGYTNGYWTNLQIIKTGNESFQILGKFQNQEVDLKYLGKHITISDIIELILFKVHFPRLDIINFQ